MRLNTLDLDLGSGGVMLLPNTLKDAAGNPMLLFGGKESRVYLVDRDNLGKFNTSYPATGNPDPRLYDRVLGEYAGDGINGTTEGIYSTPAYFNGEFYVGQTTAAALAFNVSTFASGSIPPGTNYTPTPVQSGPVFPYPEPTFTISANGTTNGIVWGMNYSASELLAFSATNISTPLYTSNTVSGDSYTDAVKFAVPTVANGMVYLSNMGGTMVAYGLRSSYLSSNAAYFSAPANLSVSLLSPSDAHLTWSSNSSLATEFRIDRSTNGSTWTTLGYTSNSVTSFDDTSFAPNTQYEYRVVAVSGASSTGFSNTFSLLNLSGQHFYLKLDTNGANLDIWDSSSASGSPSQSIPLSQLSGVAVTGSGSGNSVTVDFSIGDPLPVSGLSCNGGSGANTLGIIGDNGNDTVTVNASNLTVAGAFGSVPIAYTDISTITFAGGTGSNVLTQAAVPGGNAAVSFQSFTSSDTINVNGGSMTIPMPTSGGTEPTAQLGTLSIAGGASVALAAPTGPTGHGAAHPRRLIACRVQRQLEEPI